MGLLDIFTAAAAPVLKVLLVTAVGCILALERVNVLGEEARKHLNNVSLFISFFISVCLSKEALYITTTDALVALGVQEKHKKPCTFHTCDKSF